MNKRRGILIGAELEIAPFETATDAQFTALIKAARAGKIDLQTDACWALNDKRLIHINAFTAAGTSFSAQDNYIFISSFKDYNGCGAVLQFDFQDCLKEPVKMDANNSNAGGYGAKPVCTQIMPALVNALPDYLKALLLPFDVKSSAGNQSTTINTITGVKIALRAEIELLGFAHRSVDGEGPAGDQSLIRTKYYGLDHTTQALQWERSPHNASNTGWCYLDYRPWVSWDNSMANAGLAPFGCL